MLKERFEKKSQAEKAEILAFKTQIDIRRKEISEILKKCIKTEFKIFFEQHPDVGQVAWAPFNYPPIYLGSCGEDPDDYYYETDDETAKPIEKEAENILEEIDRSDIELILGIEDAVSFITEKDLYNEVFEEYVPRILITRDQVRVGVFD